MLTTRYVPKSPVSSWYWRYRGRGRRCAGQGPDPWEGPQRWAVTGALVAFSLVAYTAWGEFDIIRVLAEERATWDDGPTVGYGLTVTLVAGVVGAVLALLAQESLERHTARTWVCGNCGHARECTACGRSYTVPRY